MKQEMGQNCCKHSEPSAHIVQEDPDEVNKQMFALSEDPEYCGCPVLEIPLAGNAFITATSEDEYEVITDYGLGNWISENAICSIYFHLSDPGEFNLSLRLSVPQGGESVIKVSLGCEGDEDQEDRQSYNTKIKGENSHDIPIGRFASCTNGYVRLDLQGISKTGGYFGDVSHVIVTSTNCRNVSCVCEDFDFHFGRRGPSVHLNYQSTDINLSSGDSGAEYFYNEVTVPVGQDTIGSYFCAIAFCSGYFGIQVNSAEERRILFSIWSTFCTDDPSQIPEDYTVKLQRKGMDVYDGEFGGEGSGGQSFLRYDWEAGVTYKFLVRGIPIAEDNSEFTAWFYSPIENEWRLISSFGQPKKSTYLSGIYSFCENFSPETGHVGRMALYGNQWVRDTGGKWHEITRAKYTGDETSKKSRFDFAGGVLNGQFFLKNCGFFNERVDTNVLLIRDATRNPPQIDVSQLP